MVHEVVSSGVGHPSVLDVAAGASFVLRGFMPLEDEFPIEIVDDLVPVLAAPFLVLKKWHPRHW